jgi:Tol biopolymer transport system component
MGRIAAPDHLLFWRGGSAFAAHFDPKLRRVAGDPDVISQKTAGDPSSGIAYAAVAGDGTFAFVPASEALEERRLILTDRNGKARARPGPPRQYHYPRFSPDGKRIAVTIGPGHGHADEVWIYDVDTGGLTRVTFGDGNGNYYPVWTPDGKRVAFSTDRAHQGIFFKNADGSGEEEPLLNRPIGDIPGDWSRDGSTLAINRNYPISDVVMVSLKDRRETLLAKSAGAPVFSPDGRWISYTSFASGSSSSRPQIVVQSADGAAGKLQLTSEMGTFPVWTDRELIYLVDRNVMAVDAQTQPTFRAGSPRVLFEMLYERGSEPLREYDVTRDGETFVFVGGAGEKVRKEVDVVLDWTSTLASRLPGGD